MGFIGELRRKRAKEVEAAGRAAEQARLRLEQERVEKLAQQRTAEERLVAEKESFRRQLGEASQHFQQSEFPGLLKQMVDVVPGFIYPLICAKKWTDDEVRKGPEVESIGYYNMCLLPIIPITEDIINSYFKNSTPSIGAMFTWHRIWRVGDGSYKSNDCVIPITCSTDGTITLGIRKVKRPFGWGLIKEIVLPLNLWKGNPKIQEDSLSEAYNNPRFYEIHYRTSEGRQDRPGG